MRNNRRDHDPRLNFGLTRKNAGPSEIEHGPGSESVLRLFENFAPRTQPDAIVIHAISVR